MAFATCRALWFETSKSGFSVLVKPDGTRKTIRRAPPKDLGITQQSIDGWRRSILFMNEFGMDDPMAFTCEIDSLLCYEWGWDDALVFASCQAAEKSVYPYLSDEQVKQCRENVTAFYADPNLQASWVPFILHPVCLKFTKKMDDFEPIAIRNIGDSFMCLGGTPKHTQTFKLNNIKENKYIKEILYKDRNW